MTPATLTFALLAFISGHQASAADIDLLVGNNPPFNQLENGKARGMAVEITEQLLQRANISYEYRDYPWARALKTAETTKNTCIFTLGRIPQREKSFQWLGPIAQNQWAFFALTSSTIQLKSLDDARHYRIGGQRQDAKTQYLENKGFNIDLAAQEEQSMKKLYAGYIDMIAGGLFTAKLIAQDLGFDSSQLKPLLVFNQVDNYLGCSLNTDAQIIRRMNQALGNMRSDGSLQQITDKYAKELLAP